MAGNLRPRIRQFYIRGEELRPSIHRLIKHLIKVGAGVSYQARRRQAHLAAAFPLSRHYPPGAGPGVSGRSSEKNLPPKRVVCP